MFINGCESAIGDEIALSGFHSVSAAFLESGAEQVIGTLWPISDRASAIFVDYFYTSLLEQGSTTKALQVAISKMKSNPRYKHPFYWAGFVLSI